MPSPFPGMDPYLEQPRLWKGVHHRLISVAAELLQTELRQRGYYVDIDERVWLEEPQRSVYPDVAVYRHGEPPAGQQPLLEGDEPVLVHALEEDVHEGFLEIYDGADNRLITGIEFLSPTNKSQSLGRDLYRQKQRELRQAGVHLVEIDLLRDGQHVLVIALDLLDGLRPWNYLINVVRAGQGEFEVYPIRLQQRLPRIRIPLKAGDADVILDLQAVIGRVYDLGPYPQRVNYTEAPPGPLSLTDSEWIDQHLKRQGLRPAAN